MSRSLSAEGTLFPDGRYPRQLWNTLQSVLGASKSSQQHRTIPSAQDHLDFFKRKLKPYVKILDQIHRFYHQPRGLWMTSNHTLYFHSQSHQTWILSWLTFLSYSYQSRCHKLLTRVTLLLCAHTVCLNISVKVRHEISSNCWENCKKIANSA